MAILILGGTTEAAELARALAARPGVRAIFSLAGRTTRPAPAPIPLRVGGFGGVDGLARYIQDNGIKALVDATHPFARIMPFNAEAACRQAGIARLALLRPGWLPCPGDRWLPASDMAGAVARLPEEPSRIFLTIGRLELQPFATAPQHHYLVRTIDPVADGLPFPNGRLLNARGPFDAAAETALMREEAIDILVTKNAGGEATAGKLEAARALGIPVIMVERPLKPPGEFVHDVDATLAWLRAHGLLP